MQITTSYFVCGVQRSGTSLLCEALKNTGLAGVPEEYFLLNDADEPRFEKKRWAIENGAHTHEEYLGLVRERGATENGVWGSKLMWNYFQETLHLLRQPGDHQLTDAQVLNRLFPDVRYIWITRKDRVRQAVSWTIAAQSNIYASWMGKLNEADLTFDYDQIDLLHRLIIEGEVGWQKYFESNNLAVHHVIYEDLVESYEAAAIAILDYLNIDVPPDIQFQKRVLKKQATSINDVWVERYLEIQQSK